jgi:hypothetical protein
MILKHHLPQKRGFAFWNDENRRAKIRKEVVLFLNK